MYDLIIIGAGPAGLAAAVYAARQKLNFILISENVGGQAVWSSNVENYLGVRQASGIELVQKFEEHVNKYDVEFHEEEKVMDVKKTGTTFKVETDKGAYDSKTILIASGKNPRKLGVPGEEEYGGKGVAYCAVCDAPLFAGRTVAVIGGANSAMDAALLCEKYCPKIYMINIMPELTGDMTMMEKVKSSSKITVINNADTKEFIGDKFLKGVKIILNGKEKIIDVEGVFVEVGLVPSADFIKIVEKNDVGEIVLKDNQNMTSVPGIFAAGDVTDVPQKQILVASGEGVKALLGITSYIQKTKF